MAIYDRFYVVKLMDMERMSIKPGYTRVTDIFKQWDSYGMVSPKVLEEKARIGSLVHQRIELEDTPGAFFCEEDKALTRGYYDSYCLWKGVFSSDDFLKIESEERYYCDTLKITGQVDAIYQMRGGVQLIIDFKTSAMPMKTWELQAGFYLYLVKKKYPLVGDTVQFIRLSKDGKYPQVIDYHITKDVLNTCMAALRCYRWLNDA